MDADGDGILEKDGREFRFTLSTTEMESTAAVYVQEQLLRAGIRMEISTFVARALRERTLEHEFDAVIAEYNYIEGFEDFRITGYENPRLSRLRESAWSTIDPDAHDEFMREFWEIFKAEIPVTYLHPGINFLAAHRRVGGLQNYASLFSNVEHLSIKDEKGNREDR